jgi:RNA polymerase sigma-70 factor (ECF subfamily)
VAEHSRDRTDGELMAACAEGDRAAFELLVRRHADAVVSYLRGLIRDAESADDLAQDAFLAVWESRGRYRPEAEVRTWIFAIARKRYVSWVRERSRPAPPPAERAEGFSPEVEVGRKELIERALSLLDALPELEREVLVLRVFETMPYAEISEVTGVPENACRAYASRALARLRELI